MPNKQNVETLEAIKEDLKDLAAMWIVDYRGLTVSQIQELRRNIRQSDAQMKVYKNTLMKIAAKDAGLPEMDTELAGPNAFVFAHNDPVVSAKALKDFAKSNEALTIKAGVMDGELIGEEQVRAVASLPGREEIYAMFAGAVSGIARGLATTVNGVGQGLAQSVSQVAEQKPAA